jgi:hypothetical protein
MYSKTKTRRNTMKKTLLLSVVASTLIMAGGDIEPVAVPVVEEVVSGWEFGGQAVGYYQTRDGAVNDLFDQASARANAGLQLRAANKDLFWGFGAGGEVNGVGTLGLENDVVDNVMQSVGNPGEAGVGRGGWISQAYLTYGMGNTSIKAGRQELPKSLSPFAFSEGWNVFKNTFDAALVVNTDITDTTIVGAWVEGGNFNNLGSDMSDYEKSNGGAGIWMLTVQNKSVEGLALTGTWYYGASTDSTETYSDDLNILWGDAKYATGDYTIAGQIGTVMSDMYINDTVAYGVKVAGNWGDWDGALIYTGVDDGDSGVFNIGGVKTPLYSQLILNQGVIRSDNDTFVVKAGYKALGGKFGAAFNYSEYGIDDLEYTEFDLTYKTKVFNDSTTLFAGYVYTDVADDTVCCTDDEIDAQNMLRFWARYNF